MFGKLFFNLTRKNDTAYLTTNFLVPIYIIIDNSNSEDFFSKIGRISGDIVSFSFLYRCRSLLFLNIFSTYRKISSTNILFSPHWRFRLFYIFWGCGYIFT
ncbi:hypothetical protein DLNHIDIE_01326 [Acidithiobacillus thiooxidans ATCC 19377]|uniref:Uncharacterized protein n=1 Tax=Acidithiobacillus thiooxidans ATCC 19377 TaxID=637390 RepID=A0A543Q553_ACITH|nr:hypothetical protein DLNHIDIE_01326 [Acidithiobacillus thiooxidans ATCC 19377]